MTCEQTQQIKSKILKDIESLTCEISKLQENTKPIEPDCSLGTLGRFELMHDQQVEERALYEAQIRLNRLKNALQKIDKDDYGLCIECEDEIAFNRLMIIPESLYCIECASRL